MLKLRIPAFEYLQRKFIFFQVGLVQVHTNELSYLSDIHESLLRQMNVSFFN